jgi:flagellar basal body rod protein FlgC
MAMMSQVLNSAISAMMANQYALSIASNNIANANNPDYARQRLLMRPAGRTAAPGVSAWAFKLSASSRCVTCFSKHAGVTRFRRNPTLTHSPGG